MQNNVLLVISNRVISHFYTDMLAASPGPEPTPRPTQNTRQNKVTSHIGQNLVTSIDEPPPPPPPGGIPGYATGLDLE